MFCYVNEVSVRCFSHFYSELFGISHFDITRPVLWSVSFLVVYHELVQGGVLRQLGIFPIFHTYLSQNQTVVVMETESLLACIKKTLW